MKLYPIFTHLWFAWWVSSALLEIFMITDSLVVPHLENYTPSWWVAIWYFSIGAVVVYGTYYSKEGRVDD